MDTATNTPTIDAINTLRVDLSKLLEKSLSQRNCLTKNADTNAQQPQLVNLLYRGRHKDTL